MNLSGSPLFIELKVNESIGLIILYIVLPSFYVVLGCFVDVGGAVGRPDPGLV